MRIWVIAIAAIAAIGGRAEDAPRAVQVVEAPRSTSSTRDKVISSTKQFRVAGGNPQHRSNVAMLAEEAKLELLRLTGEKDVWSESDIVISVQLHGSEGDPIPLRTEATKILASDLGYEIRLDLHLSRGVEAERLKHAVTAGLVYERTLRRQSAVNPGGPFLVPPWLVDGLRESTAWRLNQSDRRLYEALFKSGGLFQLDDLFSLTQSGYEELDGAMRAAFRVSSGALTMALLEQPQGLDGFRSFVAEVADYQGEMPALLRKHFPELNLSENSLAKWWTLKLATVGGQSLATDILSISQTEEILDEALRLNFKEGEGITQQKELSAWHELASLSEAERKNSVTLAHDALVRLSFRCFPSYRPILSEYQTVLHKLSENLTEQVPVSLTALSEQRETMKRRAIKARDFIDWFEITRARETSGVFDDYLRLKDRLKANPHRRTDNLSKYLDRLDATFSRGTDNSVTTSPVESTAIPESR